LTQFCHYEDPGFPSGEEAIYKFGHSLGGFTSHFGLALSTGTNDYQKALLSGAGGLMGLFFSDSKILSELMNDPQIAAILKMQLEWLANPPGQAFTPPNNSIPPKELQAASSFAVALLRRTGPQGLRPLACDCSSESKTKN
jgi:hypothetical protein